MGAISSEIDHLLNVNCPYKMTSDSFSWFSIVFRRSTPVPPSRLENMGFIFSIQHSAHHQPLVKSEVFI